MEFKICHCGYKNDEHYFQHDYIDKIKVYQDTIQRFTIDAKNYPTKKGQKCQVKDCNSNSKIHSPIDFDITWNQEEKNKMREKYKCIIEHKYYPENYNYKEINFALPETSICNYKNCREELKNHRNISTHHFHTYLNILNLDSKDIVRVFDPEDEDIKIIWN